MSWSLYRSGRWSFRHRWTVLLGWLLALVLAGTAAATLAGPTNDAFSIEGMESTSAFALIEERTPGAQVDGATARVVFQAPEGETLAEHTDVVDAALGRMRTEHVATVVGPVEAGAVSADGRTGYATVTYTVQGTELTEEERATFEAAREVAEEAGLRVAVGGDAMQEAPHVGATELLGVGVALVVLVLTLGTLLAAGMSLVTALVGVGIGVAGITAATGFMDLGSTTPTLATMLGLAVGIDYALFVVSRYRDELARGHEPEDAAGRAIGTAGSAVIFAGATVIIALSGLSVVGIRFLTEMGLAAAATVLVAVLVAVTLLPAMLGFGRGRLAGRRPRGDVGTGSPTGVAHRWAAFVDHHRAAVLAGALAVAAVAAVPVASMQLALPDQGSDPLGSQSREAYDTIAAEFGEGANGPLLVVVDTAGAADPQAAVAATNETVAAVQDGVAAVVPAGPAGPDPQAAAAFAQQLEGAQYAVVTVVPTAGPSSEQTQELVGTLRDALADVEDATGATVYVSGQTAVGVDVSQSLLDAFPRYLAVVVGLAFLLLVLVFRSLLVPVKAVLGFLLSIAAALGVTVAVTQWGWGAGLLGLDTPRPVMSMIPLLLTGILFGLAMDYELFLVSRMREEHTHGLAARPAVIAGFTAGGRVVTAAAIIMISVFASFALTPDPLLKTIGFALAVGVLVDAFLVRMTLVPAVMALLGERIWWLPRWLDRALPDLDVEGEGLTHRLEVRTAEAEREPLQV